MKSTSRQISSAQQNEYYNISNFDSAIYSYSQKNIELFSHAKIGSLMYNQYCMRMD